jgi:TP901 family phage tail tape measure protein
VNFQDALVKVIFQGIDRMTGPMRGIDRQAAVLQARMTKLGQVGGKISAMGGRMLTFGGLGAGLGFGAMVKEAGDAQAQLIQLANIANLSDGQMRAMGNSVLDLSSKVGQSQKEILEGLQTLMGAGLSQSESMASMRTLGKVATAYGADVNETARTAYAAFSNLKVPVGEVGKLFDVLAQAGKEGNFELKDMAKELPSIAASAQMLGVTGISGASRIAAALQIARRGAGDPSEAANNMQNFLMKIGSADTERKMKKIGVNWAAEMKKFKASDDVFLAVGERLNELEAKGANIQHLFEDQQVKKFLNTFRTNLDDYRKIRDNSFNANGVVGKDFQRASEGINQSLKNLKISFTKLIQPKLEPFLRSAAKWMDRFAKNPAAFDGLLKLGAGLAALAVGMKVFGGAASLLGSPVVQSAIMGGGLARGLQGITGVMGPLLPGVSGLVLAAGPLLPIIAGLAIGAALFAGGLGLMWAYSDQIQEPIQNLKNALGGLWDEIKGLRGAFTLDLGEFGELNAGAAAAEVFTNHLRGVVEQLTMAVRMAKVLGAYMNMAVQPLASLGAGADAFMTAKQGGASDIGAAWVATKATATAQAAGSQRAGQRLTTAWGGMWGPDMASGMVAKPAPQESNIARYSRTVREAVGKESVKVGNITINLESGWGEKQIADKIVKELREAKAKAERRSLRTGPDSTSYALSGAH